ncbi:hypothetical protein WJX84_011176 [Apatococcus fuscideae]|uniref:Glycosyl transferase CAP10 domain-containing protein n=1 Tax=Apatococcus fuscideae TaxID=2026836 RepID=A0AAW1T0Y9_9CHLO
MVSRYAAALVPCLVLCSLPALYARALELEGLSGPRPLSWHSTGSIDEDVRPVTRGHRHHWPWQRRLRQQEQGLVAAQPGQAVEIGQQPPASAPAPAEQEPQEQQQQQQKQRKQPVRQQKNLWNLDQLGSDPDKAHLLRGVDRDLSPFRHRGVTLQMIEQVYCTFNLQSFRVQILDNQIYIAGELPGFRDLNLRNKRILALLASHYPDDLPDVDFVIQNSDWLPPNFNGSHEDCRQQGPMFTANKKPEDHHGILFPDESWLDWEEEQMLVYAAARRHPWEQRDRRLLFRGAPTGDRARLLNSSLGELDSDLLNIQVHEKNVVITEPIRNPAKASAQLSGLVRRLQANLTRSQAIAAEGQRLAMNVLTMDNAFSYWHHLLWEYSRLQQFTPTLHHDAVPLDRSIFQPQESVQMDFSQRLCHICLPQPTDNRTLAAFTGEHYLEKPS